MKCPFNRYKFSMRHRHCERPHRLVVGGSYAKGAKANWGYWYRDGVKWNRHGAVTP